MKTRNIVGLLFAMLTFAVTTSYAQKHVATTTGFDVHAQSSNAP